MFPVPHVASSLARTPSEANTSARRAFKPSIAMAWDLGSWLVFVRALQVLGMVVSGSLNGFLVAYVIINRLGASSTMISLEWIVSSGPLLLAPPSPPGLAVACVFSECLTSPDMHTALLHSPKSAHHPHGQALQEHALARLHHRHGRRVLRRHPGHHHPPRPRRPPVQLRRTDHYHLWAFSSCFVSRCILTPPQGTRAMLRTRPRRATLPSALATNRRAHKGQLDSYCALERGYYLSSWALCTRTLGCPPAGRPRTTDPQDRYTYTTSIVLTIFRICEGKYISLKRHTSLMDSFYGDPSALELGDKVDDHRRGSRIASPHIPPPVPPSEGVTSPRASVRYPAPDAPRGPHGIMQSIPMPSPVPPPIPPRMPVPNMPAAASSSSSPSPGTSSAPRRRRHCRSRFPWAWA